MVGNKGCVALTLDRWMKPLGAQVESRRRSLENKRRSRRTTRIQRDATAVSIARGGRRFGGFAECQQLVGGAPCCACRSAASMMR